ncbi:MAG: roadblock/LC7 domain-containing protein [Trichlorobacter sp.]|jgi:predicted regulator of Ras-like GTPase activity (Roadblock/LC7/MglB family)
MPFHDILKELVENVPHAIGAIIVDWEGEAVQEYCHCDSYDIRFVAAHKGIILSRLRETDGESQGGTIADVVVSTTTQYLLIGAVDKDYSLVLQVLRACPLGLARFHFDKALKQIREEL